MTPRDGTYDDVRRAIDDARSANGERTRSGDGGKWPQWVQTGIAVLFVVAAIFGAYASLDKRMSLLEQKLDLIIYQQSGKR